VTSFKTASFRAYPVFLVRYEFVDGTAFIIDLAGLRIRIDDSEHGGLVIFPELVKAVNEYLFRYVYDLVGAFALDAEKMVELVADDHILALDVSSDVAVFLSQPTRILFRATALLSIFSKPSTR
jgi:hypothetical protein